MELVRNIDLYRRPDGRLGRPVPALPHAKKGMGSDRLDPAEWFTEGQLEYIESYFADEFDAFGYPRLPRTP